MSTLPDNGEVPEPTDLDKVRAVETWPTPTNVSEVRSFVGLCSYCRKFLSKFADIAQALHQLTRGGQMFSWSAEAEQAFVQLKHVLTSAPVVAYLDPDGQFILDTDASSLAVGTVLSQLQGGRTRSGSRVLQTDTESTRATILCYPEELLAVVKVVRQFHPYLYGRHTVVRTDHAALSWLVSLRFPEGLMARWLERLHEYDLTVANTAMPIPFRETKPTTEL